MDRYPIFIAHVTRLGNNNLQVQFLFCETTKGYHQRWKKLAESISLDETQLRRVMANRLELTQLLSTVYENKDNRGNPMRTCVSSGKTMMMLMPLILSDNREERVAFDEG